MHILVYINETVSHVTHTELFATIEDADNVIYNQLMNRLHEDDGLLFHFGKRDESDEAFDQYTWIPRARIASISLIAESIDEVIPQPTTRVYEAI